MMTSVFFFFPAYPERHRPSPSWSPTAAEDSFLWLDRAMVFDTAERLAALEEFSVTLFELHEAPAVGEMTAPVGVVRRTQVEATTVSRLEEAVRFFYEREGGGNLAVILGRNPLYPPSEILKASFLLGQEEDAVIYAAAAADEGTPLPLTITRRYHPELFRSVGSGSPAPTLRDVVAAEALVVPLRPMRAVTGSADLPWLLHEVEREMLLGHWFPPRTYEILRHMRSSHRTTETA